MAKEPIVHTDILGQELLVGNYVAAAIRGQYSSTMTICRIVRITPKKVFLENLKTKREWSTWPHETVKLGGEEATAYILKYA